MRIIIAVILSLAIVNGFELNRFKFLNIGFSKQVLSRRKTSTTTTSSSFSSHSTSIRSGSSIASSRCDDYANYLIKQKQRWGGPIIGPIVRYINIFIVGSLGKILLGILNKFKVIRKDILMRYVWGRAPGKPLLTISNHHSIFDDPGLWGALLPWWRLRPEQMRWDLCTEDIFFANKFLSQSFGAGNVMPLDRSGSLEQPLFKLYQERLASGSWCHLFAEGRVWQNWRFAEGEDRVGPFKFGVGKLVAHCKESPIVVPMYHTGMDRVFPEKQINGKKPSKPKSIIPKIGQNIQVYFGEPLDFSAKVAAFRSNHPGILDAWTTTSESLALYSEIADEIRNAVVLLSREAVAAEKAKNEMGSAQGNRASYVI